MDTNNVGWYENILVKNEINSLNDIFVYAGSDDYKIRFRGEYYELVYRYVKLKNMIQKWDEGKLEFTPTCPKATYFIQLDAMRAYINILETRAEIEHIIL